MAETLISPGVLARENDQSQVTSLPVQAGACIVGPTVLGRVGVPKLVTSYSEYLANYGSTFASGSDEYTYFTSISAFNYFNNGGTSLIVNRVASGSWASATTSTSPIRNNEESTKLTPAPFNFTASAGTTAQGGTAGTFSNILVTKNDPGGTNSGTSINMVRGTAIGKLYTGTTTSPAGQVGTADSIAFRFDNGSLIPLTCLVGGSFTGVALGGGTGTGAEATVTIGTELGSTQRGRIANLVITKQGTGYVATDVLTIAAGALGSGMIKVAAKTPTSQNTVGTAAPGAQVITEGTAGAGSNTYSVANGTALSKGSGATFNAIFDSSAGKIVTSGTSVTVGGSAFANVVTGTTATGLTVANLTTNGGSIAGGGAGGTFTLTRNGADIDSLTITSATGATGYTTSTVITITAAGVMALAGAPFGASGITGGARTFSFAQGNLLTEIASITPTNATAVEGFQAGNTITIEAGNITGLSGANTVFTLASGDLENSGAATAAALQVNAATAQNNGDNNLIIEPTSITLAAQGGSDSFIVGDDLGVAAAANIGTPSTALLIDLQNADLLDAEAFTLETLSEGIIMNSGLATGNNGILTNGTANNVRWEIQATDIASGTFSLIIRQGNDTSTAKRVLEIFPNVSLDPKASNYISKVVGDMKKTLVGAGTADPYIQTIGSYGNASRYVRVKEVQYKTPNYFDNNGAPNDAYSSSLPDVGSGSFAGANGALFSETGYPSYAQAKYYDAITDDNTQGLTSTEMASTAGGSNYIDAFNLLANKDDYSYNIITAPGLIYAAPSNVTPLNLLIQNTANRGDAIALVDLVNYPNGTVTSANAQAAKIDNSYAAAYWPWVQVSDPNSGQLVWTVPSSMIPGVYAFNDRTSEAWFAPAGINRGGLSTVVQAQRKLTQTNRDNLYVGKVNPIATFPGKGVVVFGQKTLQTAASALDRINVRRLLIALKSFIVQIADNLVFEQNTAATRNNFLSQVNPYLESVQQRQGLYAFKVVMDASNNGPDVVDRNQMVGAIYIQPTKTAEFIYLDFNILPTGATFPS